MKKRLLLIMCLCLLAGMNAFAYQELIGGIAYNFSGNEATVTYISGGSTNQYSGDVVIPASVTYNGNTYTVTKIGEYSFQGCYNLTSVTIPESVTTIVRTAFVENSLTSITIPRSVTNFIGGNLIFTMCRNLTSIVVENGNPVYDSRENCNAIIETSSNTLISGCNNTVIPESVTSIGNSAFVYLPNLTSITIPNSVTSIGDQAFQGAAISSITIPESVTSIGAYAFVSPYLSEFNKLTYVTVKWTTPLSIESSVFTNRSNMTLYVPFGCTAAYRAAPVWQDFGVIEEVPDPVVVGSTGYATFCSPFALDFSGVTDIRAYIASGFNPATGNLLLTRVTEVPGGEGLYIVGTEGSYDVPKTTTSMYYSNLLKGVTEATNISPTDGSMTNFILSNGNYGVGFYPVSTTGELAAGKAYLQLPTALLGSNVKAVNLTFDDDDPTAINDLDGFKDSKDLIYNLAGQRIQKMQKGINIVGGKKIFVK